MNKYDDWLNRQAEAYWSEEEDEEDLRDRQKHDDKLAELRGKEPDDYEEPEPIYRNFVA